jgi:hypothetical protein
MLEKQNKSCVVADFEKQLMTLTFVGIVTSAEMRKVYTDVRFLAEDLEENFNVIADFSRCRFMYLNSLKPFKSIFQYLLSKNSGEMIRVLHPQRIISKQILNFTLRRPGYTPTYAGDLEEAHKKIHDVARRDGLRFQLFEKGCTILIDAKSHNGFILNISTSGCAIACENVSVKYGDEINVGFKLNGQSVVETFDIKAKVVRAESYTFAVNFLDLNREAKSILWGCLIAESSV